MNNERKLNLILCKIEYDNKEIQNINISNKIEYLAADIENNFIKKFNRIYEAQKYYQKKINWHNNWRY